MQRLTGRPRCRFVGVYFHIRHEPEAIELAQMDHVTQVSGCRRESQEQYFRHES